MRFVYCIIFACQAAEPASGLEEALQRPAQLGQAVAPPSPVSMTISARRRFSASGIWRASIAGQALLRSCPAGPGPGPAGSGAGALTTSTLVAAPLARRSRTAAGYRAPPACGAGAGPGPGSGARPARTRGCRIASSRFSAAGSAKTMRPRATRSMAAVLQHPGKGRGDRRHRRARRGPAGDGPPHRRHGRGCPGGAASRAAVDLAHADRAGQAQDDHRATHAASTNSRSAGVTSGSTPEPGGEARPRLMQQHAEPVDRGIAPRPRRGQQRRLQRHIDDVVDRRPGAAAASRSISSAGWPAMPRVVLLTRRPAPASAVARSAQSTSLTAAPKAAASAAPRARGAIDQPQLRHAGIEQRHGDGARRTAGAEQHRRAVLRPPGGRGSPCRCVEESEAIGIAALERAVVADDDGVDRADAPRRLAHPVARGRAPLPCGAR